MADVPRAELAPGYSIARVINGCWQLTPDHGGGPGSDDAALSRFAFTVGVLQSAQSIGTTFRPIDAVILDVDASGRAPINGPADFAGLGSVELTFV